MSPQEAAYYHDFFYSPLSISKIKGYMDRQFFFGLIQAESSLRIAKYKATGEKLNMLGKGVK